MSEKAVPTPASKKATSIRPFLWIGVVWIALSALVCWRTTSPLVFPVALRWMLGLSLLCLLDLVAIAKTIHHLFMTVDETHPNRFFSAIRASYWGAIKIACFLLFGATLLMGRALPAGIPVPALVTGVSTLAIVPLFGGLVWYLLNQKSLREAV